MWCEMTSVPIISIEDAITGEWNGFRFEIVEDDRHLDAILENIREHFTRDEVLGMSLGYSKELADSVVLYSENALKVGKGVSVVAFDIDSGDLAGVRISKITNKASDAKAADDADCYDPDFNKIGVFLDHIESKVNIFEKYDVEKYLNFVLVSVDKKFRGRGLATELILRTLRLGKKLGLTVVKSVFTGLISQKIGTKLGFDLLYEQLYSEYKVDGIVVFDKTDPHPSSKITARRI